MIEDKIEPQKPEAKIDFPRLVKIFTQLKENYNNNNTSVKDSIICIEKPTSDNIDIIKSKEKTETYNDLKLNYDDNPNYLNSFIETNDDALKDYNIYLPKYDIKIGESDIIQSKYNFFLRKKIRTTKENNFLHKIFFDDNNVEYSYF